MIWGRVVSREGMFCVAFD